MNSCQSLSSEIHYLHKTRDINLSNLLRIKFQSKEKSTTFSQDDTKVPQKDSIKSLPSSMPNIFNSYSLFKEKNKINLMLKFVFKNHENAKSNSQLRISIMTNQLQARRDSRGQENIQKLLEEYIDINSQTEFVRTLRHDAVGNGKPEQILTFDIWVQKIKPDKSKKGKIQGRIQYDVTKDSVTNSFHFFQRNFFFKKKKIGIDFVIEKLKKIDSQVQPFLG